tara:strand:+ start:78 stop:935 length:858 start_codon:yes stop_codon:yes gene_type:complete
MRQVIFTVDVELSAEEFERDNDKSYFQEFDGVENGMSAINLRYNELMERQLEYARMCEADHKVFKRDENYALIYSWLKGLDPELSHQQAINMYKLYCFDKLKDNYDKMLYLDLDVVVNTDDNFFEQWDLSQAMVMSENHRGHISTFYPMESINRIKPLPDKRSVETKYAMAHTLLMMDGSERKPIVWNTGVIGCTDRQIRKLDIFGDDLNSICKTLVNCRKETGWYNQENFCINNEAILAYLTQSKDVPVWVMDEDWHNIYDDMGELIPTSHFIHCVNKRFEDVL